MGAESVVLPLDCRRYRGDLLRLMDLETAAGAALELFVWRDSSAKKMLFWYAAACPFWVSFFLNDVDPSRINSVLLSIW